MSINFFRQASHSCFRILLCFYILQVYFCCWWVSSSFNCSRMQFPSPSLLKSSRYQIGYWYLTSRRIMGSQNWCGLEISGNSSDFPTAGKKTTSLITDWISQNCDWMNPSRWKQIETHFWYLKNHETLQKEVVWLCFCRVLLDPQTTSPHQFWDPMIRRVRCFWLRLRVLKSIQPSFDDQSFWIPNGLSK